MRFLLPVVVSLLVSSAHAADLPGVLTDYILGKVPPTQQETNTVFGMQIRVWINPKGLNTGRMVFMYTPSKGSDYWSLILFNYNLKRDDYFGAHKLTYLGNFRRAGVNIYRLEDGRFKGFYIQDEKEKDGSRVLFLYTPQAYALTPLPSGLIR